MDCVHIPASSACLCKLCIINIYWIWSFTVLGIRHFNSFEILSRVLNMDCKWPKLAFCSEIPLFYSFERWSKYFAAGKQMKSWHACATVLWMFCPPGLRAGHVTEIGESVTVTWITCALITNHITALTLNFCRRELRCLRITERNEKNVTWILLSLNCKWLYCNNTPPPPPM